MLLTSGIHLVLVVGLAFEQEVSNFNTRLLIQTFWRFSIKLLESYDSVTMSHTLFLNFHIMCATFLASNALEYVRNELLASKLVLVLVCNVLIIILCFRQYLLENSSEWMWHHCATNHRCLKSTKQNSNAISVGCNSAEEMGKRLVFSSTPVVKWSMAQRCSVFNSIGVTTVNCISLLRWRCCCCCKLKATAVALYSGNKRNI